MVHILCITNDALSNFYESLASQIIHSWFSFMIRFKLRERISDKEFREGRRIPMIEVAQRTGIGRITLSRMLNRGAVVRTDTLDRLCAYFDCQVEGLVEYVPDNEVLTSQPQN